MKDEKELFNSIESYNNYEDHLFEQYKIIVNSSQQITDYRQKANVFFITVHAAIFGLLGTLLKSEIVLWFLALPSVGILLCILWRAILKSYKELNSGKFKVIHEIEKKLPLRLFDYEWEVLGRGKNSHIYTPTTTKELYITWLFMAIHFFVFVGITIDVFF